MCLLAVLLCTAHLLGQNKIPPVSVGPEGKLIYTTDSLGNRVPDFSFSGYMSAEKPIPDVPVKIVVPAKEGDATARIQAALDYVGTLAADKNGFRGAVLLEKGRYEVNGSLTLSASGVVLRGSGMGADGTTLVGTGLRRQTLITIEGENDRVLQNPLEIVDEYVPVNGTKLRLPASHGLGTGDQVVVQRPSTQAWIDALGTEDFGGNLGYFGWKPGEQDIFWDRTITAVEGNQITLDVPITTALDHKFGGAKVIRYTWPGRISQVGVESLKLVSSFDKTNPKDENHRWTAITLGNLQDAWVRQVVFQHFAGSAVAVLETARRITVEDCKSLDPVSEIGGHRRYTFWTRGQQTLFQRLYAESGYHDFAVGHAAAGPNAFVQCQSYLPHSFSGAIDSWASGLLFDIVNVDGHAISFANRRLEAQGAGWTAANSMLWQSSAAQIICPRPPTANNWAFGVWAQLIGDGYWHEENSHIKPYSLYYAQLQDRLGEKAAARAQLLTIKTNPTSSPTVEQAAELAALSDLPAPLLSDWIDKAPQRQKIPADASGVKTVDQLRASVSPDRDQKKKTKFEIYNGWFVNNGRILTGKHHHVRWWRGGIRPMDLRKTTPHVTRYVPGKSGQGATDVLEEVAEWMVSNDIVALDHNYGLWYDRRRDDHERVRRMNGEVWAPFYELPYARSGKGKAWDGLSKYDLTKFNPWYWDRLRKFADLADVAGLVLLHQNYFQHNILEAGAHWSDFPWRSANNINDTGFPEPPPYAGDKRIFQAEQFYDVSHPRRRALHRQYIRKCLKNFADNESVIQFTSAEYTGPLHFVQFWLDVILEWQKETGNNAKIALSSTKDVQDAILEDHERAAVVDVIDIRYWHYRQDGSLYAPKGGQHLAPRQHARLVSQGKRSFEQTYRAVREYREKFPEKAVMYTAGGGDQLAWASFMAGGSLAAIPAVQSPKFLTNAATMKPSDRSGKDDVYILENESDMIIYSRSSKEIQLPVNNNAKGKYIIRWIDPETGEVLKEEKRTGTDIKEVKLDFQGPVVLWVSRRN